MLLFRSLDSEHSDIVIGQRVCELQICRLSAYSSELDWTHASILLDPVQPNLYKLTDQSNPSNPGSKKY